MVKHELSMDELKAKYSKIDPFLIRKWVRLFDIFFDRNASDNIENADFFIVLRQARNIYGAQSEQAKYARGAMTKLWDGLRKEADKNKDSKISITEWIDFLAKSSRDKHDGWFTDYEDFIFKLFDVSNDGVLDLAEYTDGLHCYGYAESDAHEAFDTFTTAHAHQVTTIDKKHFHQLWLDYFFSKDKKAVGNNLFGVLKD